MDIAAVAELKAKLSRYLRRVKAGEEILVTERNVPVARIVPVTAPAGEEALRDLERQGFLRRGCGKPPKKLWGSTRPRADKTAGRQPGTRKCGARRRGARRR